MHTSNTVSIEVLDCMYADGYGSSHTTPSSSSSLDDTHLPSWHGKWTNCREVILWGDLEPKGSLLKKISYSCTKCTTYSRLCSAAPCCSLRKLQLSSAHIHKLSATFSTYKVWNQEKKKCISTPQTYLIDITPAQSWEWERLLPINLQALQNQRNKTLGRRIYILTDINARLPTDVTL